MKFVSAVIIYLLMAFVLAWGILDFSHGRHWLLIAGVLGYVLMLAKIGCLPPKSHH